MNALAPVNDTLEKALHHEWTAEALGALLALRYDRPRCFLLAIGGLMALDPEDREAVAETVLADLRRGPPVPPFDGVRAEAELWASFASPAELKHYLVAAWNALPEHDRQAFLRRAA